jgi:hypothetical protein
MCKLYLIAIATMLLTHLAKANDDAVPQVDPYYSNTNCAGTPDESHRASCVPVGSNMMSFYLPGSASGEVQYARNQVVRVRTMKTLTFAFTTMVRIVRSHANKLCIRTLQSLAEVMDMVFTK